MGVAPHSRLLRCSAVLALGLWVAASLGAQEPWREGTTRWLRWRAPEKLATIAARYTAEADHQLKELAKRLQLGPPRPGVLIWVRDQEAIGKQLGHSVPQWFAAVALPMQSKMVIAVHVVGGEAQLRSTLRHELVHHAMGALGAGAFQNLPSWFHEGCAEYFSGEVYLGNLGISLGWRAANGSLPPLSKFDHGFGDLTISAAEGYALAEAFISRLVRVSGEQVLPQIFHLLQQGRTLDQALLETTGLPLITHEELMRQELTSLRQLMRDFAPHWITMLFLLTLFLFPLVRRTRRRRERELQMRWQAQEEAAAKDALSRQQQAMDEWLERSESAPPAD